MIFVFKNLSDNLPKILFSRKSPPKNIANNPASLIALSFLSFLSLEEIIFAGKLDNNQIDA